MSRLNTIHTSRTMMFKGLSALIEYRKAGGITIIQFEPLLNHIQ